MKKSDLEEILEEILKRLKIDYKKQFKFHPERRWKCDFYLPDYKCILEADGGQYIKSRHRSPKGYFNDMEKYNEIILHGYKLLRFTTDHFKEHGIIIATLKRLKSKD